MPLTQREQQRDHVWPSCVIALIAVLQLLLTLAIVGLETTSFIVDLYHSMVFIGYAASVFYMITWISMFTITCCNGHSLCCVTHVLVENILSLIASSVLLYYDTLFLNNPYTCTFGSGYACSQSYEDNTRGSSGYRGIFSPTGYTLKLSCIKAQLACAAVMLTTNVIYIIIYTVVALRVRKFHNSPAQTYASPPIPQFSTQFPIPPNSTDQYQRTAASNPFHTSYPNYHHEIRTEFGVLTTSTSPTQNIGPTTTPGIHESIKSPLPVQGAHGNIFSIDPKLVPRPPLHPQTIQPTVVLSDKENSWRENFPRRISVILGVLQIILITLIAILEIASLGIHPGLKPTGVGLWAGLFCSMAPVLKILLERKWDRSRLWATRVLIVEIVSLVFSFILIGIIGDYINNGGYVYSSYYSTLNPYGSGSASTSQSLTTKYQIMQAQLVFSILLMFSGFIYIGLYIYVTIQALWRPYHDLDLPHLFKIESTRPPQPLTIPESEAF